MQNVVGCDTLPCSLDTGSPCGRVLEEALHLGLYVDSVGGTSHATEEGLIDSSVVIGSVVAWSSYDFSSVLMSVGASNRCSHTSPQAV